MKITPYQTHQTNNDGSLAQSYGSKRKSGIPVTNEKGRLSVDTDIELKSALQGLRTSYNVSKLNLPTGLTDSSNMSPQPFTRMKEQARTPLNFHKSGLKEGKSPKASTAFFNGLGK